MKNLTSNFFNRTKKMFVPREKIDQFWQTHDNPNFSKLIKTIQARPGTFFYRNFYTSNQLCDKSTEKTSGHDGGKKRNKRRFLSPEREDYIKRLDFEKYFEHPHLRQVDINLIGGNLIILSGTSNKIRCRIQWHHKPLLNMLPNIQLKNDILCVSSHKLNPFLGQKNRYIIELVVPPYVCLKAHMAAGTVYVDGINGDLDIALLAGDIRGNSLSKCTKISVKAGSVKLHHLCGSVNAHVGAGDLELLFDELHQDSNVNLSCLLGDISLRFPSGFLYSDQIIRRTGNIKNTLEIPASTKIYLGDVYADTEEIYEQQNILTFKK